MALSSSGDDEAILAEAQALRRTLSPAKRKAVLQQTRSWKSPVKPDHTSRRASSSDEEIARLVREYRYSLSQAGRTTAQQAHPLQASRQPSLKGRISTSPYRGRTTSASGQSRLPVSRVVSLRSGHETRTGSVQQDSSESDDVLVTAQSRQPSRVRGTLLHKYSQVYTLDSQCKQCSRRSVGCMISAQAIAGLLNSELVLVLKRTFLAISADTLRYALLRVAALPALPTAVTLRGTLGIQNSSHLADLD